MANLLDENTKDMKNENNDIISKSEKPCILFVA